MLNFHIFLILGSVLGKCRGQSFDQMTQCNCVALDFQNNDNQPGGINSNRPSLIDILNGAGLDGRSASARRVEDGCPKNFINR